MAKLPGGLGNQEARSRAPKCLAPRQDPVRAACRNPWHLGSRPELIYALREAGTGKGLATEMARTMIDQARTQAGHGRILASLDALNERSVRVLEKLGFHMIETRQGAFGELLVFALEE